MEIEKAEKLFEKIIRISHQETNRSNKFEKVDLIAKSLIVNTLFFCCAFYVFVVYSLLVGFANLININGLIVIFFTPCVSALVTYFIFWKKVVKNMKRKNRWSQKIEELKTKKARLQEELNLVIEEKIDDYFIEIQELEKEDKLELLSEKFIDKIVETKKEKVLALKGRSNAIREVAILEKEINEMNNNSFITNN